MTSNGGRKSSVYSRSEVSAQSNLFVSPMPMSKEQIRAEHSPALGYSASAFQIPNSESSPVSHASSSFIGSSFFED